MPKRTHGTARSHQGCSPSSALTSLKGLGKCRCFQAESILTNHRIHFSMWCVMIMYTGLGEGEPCKVTYTCWYIYIYYNMYNIYIYITTSAVALPWNHPQCVAAVTNWLGSQAANRGPQNNRTYACPAFNHASWPGCDCKLTIAPRATSGWKWNCCCPELFSLLCPLPLDAAKPFSMVVFHCRHMFHKECLPVPSMVSGWLGHHQLESSWCSQRDVLKNDNHPLMTSSGSKL